MEVTTDQIMCFVAGAFLCSLGWRALTRSLFILMLGCFLCYIPVTFAGEELIAPADNPVEMTGEGTNQAVHMIGAPTESVLTPMGAFWVGFGFMFTIETIGFCIRISMSVAGHREYSS